MSYKKKLRNSHAHDGKRGMIWGRDTSGSGEGGCKGGQGSEYDKNTLYICWKIAQ
jgi:hypothetical protein